MTDGWPKIRSRRVTRLSPWTAVIEREVEFNPGDTAATYHALQQADYVTILALTPDNRIPLVGQFRPAVETFTWELPAGLIEPGEDPINTCRRELLEETGFAARTVTLLGITAPDTGRLSNRMHSFFVETDQRVVNFSPEPSMFMRLVTAVQLAQLIITGEFVSQLHLGTLMLAQLHSRLNLI